MPCRGAACSARQRLHRLATGLLSKQELRDGLLLLAFGLLVLPLIPTRPLSWLGGINTRPLAAMVLLILLLQAAGHVALRLLGPQRGFAVAGFFSGFVSSTATIASLGSRSRSNPELHLALTSGAILSTAATWVQALLIVGVLSPLAARVIAPLALAGLACALLTGVLLMRRARSALARSSEMGALENSPEQGSALRLREALIVALLLSVVTLLVTTALQRFGEAGLLTSVALAGLADAHAPIASLAALFAGQSLAERDLIQGVLLAITANGAIRMVTAFVSGGPRYGARVAMALTLELTAAWIAGLMWPGLM